MKFAVTVTLKKDVLDPQGKVVQDTVANLGMKSLKNIRQGKFFEILANLGMKSLKNIRQGKFFEIEIDEKNQLKAEELINEMCKKLLVNLIIEDYKINKL